MNTLLTRWAAALAVLSLHLIVVWQLIHYQARQVIAVVDSDVLLIAQLSKGPVAEIRPNPKIPSKAAQTANKPFPKKDPRPLSKVKPPPLTDPPKQSVNQSENLPETQTSMSQGSSTPDEPSASEMITPTQAAAKAPEFESAANPAASTGAQANGAKANGAQTKVETSSEALPGVTARSEASGKAADSAVQVPTHKLVSLESLYRSALAPFPNKTALAFAVHSPKDYQESGGASGEALVFAEAARGPEGQETFKIDLEIKLSWLLRKVIGGSLLYRSEGNLGQNGPQTLRYSEKIGDRAERWLEVDRSKREMKSHQIAALPLQAGTQDRLSVIWLLGMLARSDPEQLEKGKVFTVPMFTFRQIYPARFESFGNEVLLAPAGALQTLHVAYQSTEAGSDKVDLWLGYDQQMQPVRIRWQEAQGRVIDLILLKKP